MKLYGLYLKEQPEAAAGAPEASAVTTPAPGTTGTKPVAKDKLSMSPEAAKKKIDAITINVKKSIEGLVGELQKLPVMATNAQAKSRVTYLMGNLAKFKETFDENGVNYQAILAAMQAGGKATGGIAGIPK